MNILTTFMLAASDAPRPPSVGSVILSDVAGGNRFTSTAFPVTVTMADDGNPLSTKGMKAYVQGDLTSYAQTSAITGSTTTGSDPSNSTNWVSPTLNIDIIGSHNSHKAIRPVGPNSWIMLSTWTSGNSGSYVQNSQLRRLSNQTNPYAIAESNWSLQSPGWVGGSQSRGFVAAGSSWWAVTSVPYNGNNEAQNTLRLETSSGTQESMNRDAGNLSSFCDGHYGTEYLFYAVFSKNSTTNTYMRRLTNGSSKVTLTTQASVSFGNGHAPDMQAPRMFRLGNNEYYHDNSGGEILQGSSTTFQTLATLGRAKPNIPSYTLFQKENSLYFVYSNTAYITEDMITYRTQTFNPTPSANHNSSGYGNWNGMFWTRIDRHNSGNYTEWMSFDDCQTWVAPFGQNGSSQYGFASGTASRGGYVIPTAPALSNMRYGKYVNRYYTDLTLTDSTGISNFDLNEPVSEVLSNGSAGDAKGYVLAASGSSLKVQLQPGGSFDNGNSVKTGNKVLDNVTLYCTLNSSGVVSNLTPSDPGFVTQTATPTQVSFPGTFSSGNAPDADLPAGTTLTVQVNATNIEGTDSATSNTITPI